MALISNPPSDDVIAKNILDAFMSQLVNNLCEQAINEIKPKIRDACEQAVRDIQPQVQSYVEKYSNSLIIQISIKDNAAPSPR